MLFFFLFITVYYFFKKKKKEFCTPLIPFLSSANLFYFKLSGFIVLFYHFLRVRKLKILMINFHEYKKGLGTFSHYRYTYIYACMSFDSLVHFLVCSFVGLFGLTLMVLNVCILESVKNISYIANPVDRESFNMISDTVVSQHNKITRPCGQRWAVLDAFFVVISM